MKIKKIQQFMLIVIFIFENIIYVGHIKDLVVNIQIGFYNFFFFLSMQSVVLTMELAKAIKNINIKRFLGASRRYAIQ